MPAVLTEVTAVIAEVGAEIGLSTAVTQAVVSTAIAVGLSALSSFLFKPSLGNQEQKQNIRQPTAGRRRYYGYIGGARVSP